MKIPAIILSAGASKRMGMPKALLKVGKKTLLEDQIKRLTTAGCEPIIVVSDGGPDQFSSIKCGLKALKDHSKGCLILPIDVPFVPVDIIKKILRPASPKLSAIIPRQGKQYGHPIWISALLAKKIFRTKKGRLDRLIETSKNIMYLPTRSRAILNNVNTPKDWLACLKK